MCGIAGIFHLETAKPVDPERVKRMTDAIAHRGPDGSGVWTAPGVGLGHRRLSIIDLEGGAQPMHSDDEALTLSFNGEIYNFQELAQGTGGGGPRLSHQQRQRGHPAGLAALGSGLRVAFSTACLPLPFTMRGRGSFSLPATGLG